MSLEDGIIKAVSEYPGTNMHGFSDMVIRMTNVLVAQGKLCVRYNGTEKCYYHPEQTAEKDAKVYLAASRHRDGTIHIYLKGKDVGMRIRPSPSEDHMIITTDDDSFGLVKLSDVARLRNKISEQADHIGELTKELKTHVDKMWTCENANKQLVAKEEMWLRELHSSKTLCTEHLTTILQQLNRIDELSEEITRAEKKEIRRLKVDITNYMDTINKQSRRIDQLLDERMRFSNQVGELEDATKLAAQNISRNVGQWMCKTNELEHIIQQNSHDRETLRATLKTTRQRVDEMEEDAREDAAAWKKRESELLQMVVDRDAAISRMTLP